MRGPWAHMQVADRATRERSSCRTPLSPMVSTVQRVSDPPRDRFVRMGESNTPKLGRAAARLLDQRIISARAGRRSSPVLAGIAGGSHKWPQNAAIVAIRLLDNGLITVRPASGHFRVTYLGLVTVTRGEAIAARARTLRWPALTNRQRQVLFTLVDWERAAPGTGDFILRLSIAGAYFVGHQDARIERSDLEQLGAKGYLHVRQPPKRGGLMVSLTAEGHAFYEDHQREHQPAEQLAARVRQYVDTAAAAVYPDAVARLGEAADALWSARHDPDVTSVGFTCREALQSFALAYYARFYPRAQDEPIAKENTRRLG